MTPKNKILAGGAIIATVATLSWVALSHMATNRAEESIQAVLDDYGIRQYVQWEHLSASPFGKVRIDDITITVPGATLARIAHAQLNDFTSTDERKHLDLRLEGIANAQGFSPLTAVDYALSAGQTDMLPLSAHAKWDLRLDDDQGTIELSLTQPGLLQADLAVELDKVDVMANLAQNLAGPTSAAMNPLAMFGPAMLMTAQSAIGALGDIQLRRLNLKVEDDGYVASSIALYKRYSIDVVPASGDPSKAREKVFQEVIKAGREECKNAAAGPLKSLPSVEDSCEAIADFLGGESSRLTFEATPKRPVSLATLFQQGRFGSEQMLLSLNPVIK